MTERNPLFIIGINQRCGSNYIYNLIIQHPDCVQSNQDGEAFVMYNSNILLEYHRAVVSNWNKNWNNNPKELLLSLGDGIISYLEPKNGEYRYHVSKTPRSDNMENFLKIFRKGKMLVIYRCGQDVVESHVITFKHRFDDAVRGWVRGANSIISANQNSELMNSGRVKFVRYEDLYTQNREVMTDILQFLGLDVAKYDFAKSDNFHVIGSAELTNDAGKVTWKPMPKSDSFDPTTRSRNWSVFKHYRFNWMAGKQSEALGYPLMHKTYNPVYFLYNWFMSAYDFLFRTIRRTKLLWKAYRGDKSLLSEIRAMRIN